MPEVLSEDQEVFHEVAVPAEVALDHAREVLLGNLINFNFEVNIVLYVKI